MPDLQKDGPALIEGPAGPIEVLIDVPAGERKGIAIVTHPQPLLGGDARHKIPHFLARALREKGWWVARPNFRGAGRSAGTHDSGRGETDDVLAVHDALTANDPSARIALVGFSFGAFVQARAAQALARRGAAPWRTSLAGMPYGAVEGNRYYDTPADIPPAQVIHGERDERVPLENVLAWARPCSRPIVVIPGADHFFSGRLPLLRDLILEHLRD